MEKVLNKAFAAKIAGSNEFASWFLSKTGFANRPARVVVLRPNNPWYRSPTTRKDSETDIFMVFEETGTSERFAIHIENKSPIDKEFRKNQPENYHFRAREWAKQEKYGNYDEYEAVLIAPRSFYIKNKEKADIFNCFVSYEDLSAFMPEFAAAMGPAPSTGRNPELTSPC